MNDFLQPFSRFFRLNYRQREWGERMKKRLILIVCVLLGLCLAARADGVPSLSTALYGQAKEALSRLSYGDFEQISPVLSWNGAAPSAADWEALAGQFSTLNNGTVQRDISVAFWWDQGWHIAVPVMEPKSDNTEALVLSSADGQRFDHYARAQWGKVRGAYESSDYVAWNEEYVESMPIIVGDE